MSKAGQITTKQIDSLLRFLPEFEAPGFSIGDWHSGGGLPCFVPSESVSQFVELLYKDKWIYGFDWGKWQENAEQLVYSPDLLAAEGLETIRKLFTIHVRKDQFCSGHLEAMFENGHIVAVLRRLKAIRATMGVKQKSKKTHPPQATLFPLDGS